MANIQKDLLSRFASSPSVSRQGRFQIPRSAADRIIDRAESDSGADLSNLREAVGRAAAGSGDSDEGYVTHGELRNLIGAIAPGIRFPMPIRSTTTAMTTGSTSLSLSGTFSAGMYFVAVAVWNGPPTVQVNAISATNSVVISLDGMPVQGNQSPPPIMTSRGSSAFAMPLDVPGTALTGTATGPFVTADTGSIWYGCFASEEEAYAYFDLAT